MKEWAGEHQLELAAWNAGNNLPLQKVLVGNGATDWCATRTRPGRRIITESADELRETM